MPGRKSPGLIIGIVLASVLLLAAVGGIVIALNRDDGDQPVTTVTPGTPPAPPPTDPTEPATPVPSDRPTTEPSDRATSAPPPSRAPTPRPTEPPSPRSGDRVELSKGITIDPVEGWEVRDSDRNAALLSNGKEAFLGRVLEVKRGANAEQFCEAYNREITKEGTDQEYAEPEPIQKMPSSKLKGASCLARLTDTSGQESVQIYLSTLVSVRNDGLTVAASLIFLKNTKEAVGKDAAAMAGSMIAGQL